MITAVYEIQLATRKTGDSEMIIDFSFRPPYKSLGNMEVYKRRPEDTFAKNNTLASAAPATGGPDALPTAPMFQPEI